MARDITVTSYLPTLLAVRPRLVNAINRIDAYQVLCLRTEWGTEDTAEQQTGAFHTVCACVIAAANQLDLMPEERAALVRKLETARIENEGLRATNDRLRSDKQHLEAALVRLTAEMT